MNAGDNGNGRARYGMVIDLDRCAGCGACIVACAVENNVAVPPPAAGTRKSLTWLRVHHLRDPRQPARPDVVDIPLPCQHCDHDPPCVSVCPQNAIDRDPETGIVSQIPDRCLGCRYCVAACPYHVRTFNWWDPQWPAGMEEALNPHVSPRMRGVVEKCNFCHARLQAAKQRAAAAGRRTLEPGEYMPACVEACPAGALQFGNFVDPRDPVSRAPDDPRAFRLLERLGSQPKVIYLSSRAWVVDLGEESATTTGRSESP